MHPKVHSPAFLALVNEAKSEIREMNVEQYRKMCDAGEDHVLIDVREDGEWSAGHAAGAIHLGKGIIERDIEKTVPDKSARMVLYCGGGYRSALAAAALKKMGYSDAISLDGGWREWQAAGLPTGV